MLPAVDVPLVLVSLFGALYALGERRAVRVLRRPRSQRDRWRAASYYAGLVVILVALVSPIDSLAEKLFWVHMVQHVLLLTVAAPLIVLGAPWSSIWRPLPLGFRRSTAKTISRAGWCAPLRALGRLLARPIPVWIVFNANLVLWHIPAVYDLAVRDGTVHALEHATYVLFAILLWSQVLDSPPLRARLSAIQRVYYIVAASVVSWVISLVLIFSTSPLYPAYAHLNHRPGGISALSDQQLAGGVMLVPGSLAMTVFVFIQLYIWMGLEGKSEPPRDHARLRNGPSADDGPRPSLEPAPRDEEAGLPPVPVGAALDV
jgi:putative membrane protein